MRQDKKTVTAIIVKLFGTSQRCKPYFLHRFLLLSLVLTIVLPGCTVKPEPIKEMAVQRRVQTDLGRMFKNQEPAPFRITLHEAMARAVKYNLKRRIKQLEEALAVEDLALTERALWPKTALAAGYSVRDKEIVTNSNNSAIQVVEKDDKQGMANLTWTWSILDFGVSYVQARQKADQVLIYRQKRRKSIQNIIQDVRIHYWQAAMTDALVPQIDILLEESKKALADVQRMEAAGQEVPVIAIDNQQILLDTTHKLWEMRKTLVNAKSKLAILMNLPPGTLFVASSQGREALDDSLVYMPTTALDHYALLHRAELRQEDYQERIGALEVRKVLLKMLPNLTFSEEFSHDSNQYLQNQTWRTLGMQLSWDLFNLVATPKKLTIAKLGKEVVRARRLAYSMATVTQLRIALQSYHISKRDLKIAGDINRLQARKVEAGESDRDRIDNTDIKRIQQRAQSLKSRMEQGLAFARMQSALGRIHLTLGVDPLPINSNMDFADIKTTAQIIAMRQSSVTSAVISAIPKPLLLSRINQQQPQSQATNQPETDTGSLDRSGTGLFWDGLEKISQQLDQKKGEKTKLANAQYANYPTQPMPGYIPPGAGTMADMLPQPPANSQPPLPPEAVQVILTAD